MADPFDGDTNLYFLFIQEILQRLRDAVGAETAAVKLLGHGKSPALLFTVQWGQESRSCSVYCDTIRDERQDILKALVTILKRSKPELE